MSSWTKLRAGGKYRRVARHFDCLATARSPRLASPTVRIRCPEAAGDGRACPVSGGRRYRRCRGCGAGRRMDKRGKIKKYKKYYAPLSYPLIKIKQKNTCSKSAKKPDCERVKIKH